MKIFNEKKVAGQQGFTLIELLVVIAILAVLATIAIPAYSRFFGAGSAEANAAELSHIQAAMDAMMATNRITFVEEIAGNGWTDTFDGLPRANGLEGTDFDYLYSDFLRVGNGQNPTRCEYQWDNTGFVIQREMPNTDPIECHS